MSVLVVAAHPDDEALGCGGTIRRFANLGVDVDVLFVADGVGARGEDGGLDEAIAIRRSAAGKALSILGARHAKYLDFHDNQLDSYPRLNIVKQIEAVISELQPEIIFTHHAGDLNVDHAIVNQCVLTACRPQPGHPVKEIYAFEVQSSTEWQAPSAGMAFLPNVYFDISGTLEEKLASLDAYSGEMRAFPHSRSLEAVKALAVLRGSHVGVGAAEAFEALRIIK